MARDYIDLKSPTYTPGRLLDATARELGARNDRQLAYVLETNQPRISRYRQRLLPLTERIMIAIMDRTDWTLKHVRELMGVPFDGGPIRAHGASIDTPAWRDLFELWDSVVPGVDDEEQIMQRIVAYVHEWHVEQSVSAYNRRG